MLKRIALVEDEPSHAILIRYNLEQNGYQIDHYSSVQISDFDGLKLCEEIRATGIQTYRSDSKSSTCFYILIYKRSN